MAESDLLVEMAQNDMTCPVVAALTPNTTPNLTPLSPESPHKSDTAFPFAAGASDPTAAPTTNTDFEADTKRSHNASGGDESGDECCTIRYPNHKFDAVPPQTCDSDGDSDGVGVAQRVAIAELFWGPQFSRTLPMYAERDRRSPSTLCSSTLAIGRNPNGRELVDVDLGHSSFISRLHLELHFEPTATRSPVEGSCALTPKVSPDCSATQIPLSQSTSTSTSSSSSPSATAAHTTNVHMGEESQHELNAPLNTSGIFAGGERAASSSGSQTKQISPSGTFTLRVIGKNGVFVNDVFVGRETPSSPLPSEYAQFQCKLQTISLVPDILFSVACSLLTHASAARLLLTHVRLALGLWGSSELPYQEEGASCRDRVYFSLFFFSGIRLGFTLQEYILVIFSNKVLVHPNCRCPGCVELGDRCWLLDSCD